MNQMGKDKIPFLFIIDFEMKKPLLFELDKVDKNILYFVNGISNYSEQNHNHQKAIIKKFPSALDEYREKFDEVLKNIMAGNSYLLNLTLPTHVHLNLTLEEIFHLSKASYKLLLRHKLVCFTPETFIKIKEGKISSYPMKGTINAAINNAEQIILNDPKETAEHNTIVDLIRNDLSMVAKKVTVDKFRYIDKIKTTESELLQVSSQISGTLDDDYNKKIGEIIFKLLPAGSICGAPKEKTVEIILETEKYSRGYYTGIFGIFDGVSLDSAVMIRFIEQTDNGLVFKSGGGITSFSNLHSEYNEMIEKIYVPIN